MGAARYGREHYPDPRSGRPCGTPGIPRLENMTTKIVPAASAGDLSDLRRLWPKSLCSGFKRGGESAETTPVYS